METATPNSSRRKIKKLTDDTGSDQNPNLLDSGQQDAPSVLLDSKYGLVIMVNQVFCDLVQYSKEQLVGHHISLLFPNLIITNLLAQGSSQEQLLTRSGHSFSSQIAVKQLQQETDAVLLLIHPQEEEGAPLSTQRRFDAIRNLLFLIEEQSLEIAMGKAIPILRALFRANAIAFYLLDDKSPLMNRYVAFDHAKILPRTLPASDMMMLSKPLMWRNNQEGLISSERPSFRMHLQFLLSIPLGVASGVIGLVLIGDETNQPPGDAEKLLELTRINLNSLVLHFVRIESLHKEIARLHSSIKVHENVISNLKDGLILLTPDLHVQEINTAAEIMLGYTAQEVSSLPAEDILIGSALLLTALNDAQAGIAAHNLGTVQLHHRVGYPFSARVQVLPVNELGKVTQVILIITDISEYEQITLRTQQLEHRAILGEFISAFAHDVRNPINNLSTSLQLLQRRFGADDPNREIVNRLGEDCDRLTQLMEQFLSYSRLVDNTRFEVVDIEQVLQRILSKWKPTLETQGIQLHYSSATKIPSIRVDRRAMERVFINLISNAVEAMSENIHNPVLGVRISREETSPLQKQQIRISISDNGAGIPPELRERVFDPFMTTKGEGTGLGLSISKQIVTAHRGTITVESFPGGTVFHILLPIRELEEDEPDRIDRR
ncbi:MAG: PAS domain-containing protein [Anaerolineae bacterium]|nr:PAS domain-containing protein [Anaerolineae bacterium]